MGICGWTIAAGQSRHPYKNNKRCFATDYIVLNTNIRSGFKFMIDIFKKPYYIKRRNSGQQKLLKRVVSTAPAIILICLSAWLSGCTSFTPTGDNRPLSTLVDVYRGPLDHLNAVRSGTCPMHPSCSAYAIEATEKHGPLTGWMMTFDRLIRCGRDELKRAPEIPVNGKWRYYDPIHANDFWWHSRDQISGTTNDRNEKEFKWAPTTKYTDRKIPSG